MPERFCPSEAARRNRRPQDAQISRFRTGAEVLEILNIKDFELVDYVRNGLIPYDENGAPTVFDTIYRDLLHGTSDLAKVVGEYEREEAGEFSHPLDVFRKEIAINKDILRGMSERGLAGLSLPNGHKDISGKISRSMISRLVGALYNAHDLQKFRNKEVAADLLSKDANAEPEPSADLTEGPDNKPSRRISPKQQALLPCPPGIEWEQISVFVNDDDTIRIKAPHGQGSFTFTELGMRDRRKPGNSPKVVWSLLTQFAKSEGCIGARAGAEHFRNLVKSAQELDEHLSKAFGIQDSIYEAHYRVNRRYKLKFQIFDRTSHHEKSDFSR